MKKFLCTLLCAVCILMTFTVDASAAVRSFPDYFMDIELDDDVLVMTSKTEDYDPVWVEAGISDPDDMLEQIEQMNIVAVLFDKKTESMVNIINKWTEETGNIFTFEGKTKDEVFEIASDMMTFDDTSTTNSDGQPVEVTYDVSVIDHETIPFFKVNIKVNDPSQPASEVLFGGIINGHLYEIDQYLEGDGTIDESFIKKVVDNLSFTRVLTKEEYEEIQHQQTIRLIVFAVIVLLIFVALFVVARINKRRKEKKTQMISDNIQEFRKRKANGEVDIKTTIVEATGTYTVKSIEKFVLFNTWIRNLILEIFLFALLLLIVWYCFTTDSVIYAILVAVCGAVSLYFNFSNSEKLKANMMARYDAKNKPVARYRFCEEFFTMAGAGAMAEYLYDQVMSVRVYGEYIYIFFGTEQGVIIDQSSLTDEEMTTLINHVKSHLVKR